MGDTVHPAKADGLSQAEPEVSALRASIPDAGFIDARIYDQQGNLQPFPMRDCADNRHFAAWLRQHDRYTPTQINEERKVK